MTSRRSTRNVDLARLAANPDEIYGLLDEIDSDWEIEDGENDEDWIPSEEVSDVQNEEVEDSDEASDDYTDQCTVHNNKKVPILKWSRVNNFEGENEPEYVLPDPTEVLTPWCYFRKYLGDSFFQICAERTAQYYLQKNGKELKPIVTPEEIKTFFGIHAIMGCIKFPRIHFYWSTRFKFPAIADKMPRDRFYLLRVNLHVVDACMVTEQSKKNNRLWRVQPMIDLVRNRCLEIKRYSRTAFSIDEQMIPFLGRCALRQYVKNKPRPVGLKNFVLTTSDGTVLDFEIYQGSTTNLKHGELGLGPSVVMRLVETLPVNSFVFFDRYFSTVPLFSKLSELQIHGTGTIMSNRFKGFQFQKDNQMNRGDSEQVVSSDKKITVTKWKDNKSVLMASTAFGKEPIHEVRRWDKSSASYVEVPCPNVVKVYNEKMGGVDICDQMMECYRTFYKTRKWTFKVILHLFDLAIVNSWMEYRQDCRSNKYKAKEIKDFLSFRLELAEYLLSGSKTSTAEHTDGEDECEERHPKKMRPSPLPCSDKRYDGFNHWPIQEELKNPLCCRLESCQSRSRVSCSKCKVHLCMNKSQNCFLKFHSK